MSAPTDPAAEPRQRWRLVVARSPDAPAGTQRDVVATWTAALEASGLPLVASGGQRGRSRVAFGAPLPVGMAAEGELIDVVLTERWPAWQVRVAIAGYVPEGWHLVDVYDVWLGGQPLAGRVVAADYRVELLGAPDARALEQAAAALLAADHLPRRRQKNATTVEYDLRPLLAGVTVDPQSSPAIQIRTRFDPELGTGRPEEVLAALGERLGAPLEARTTTRERLVLADDVDAPSLD